MKPGCASSATFTPCSAAKRPASSQYGIAFFSHCHSSTSRNSGGHGVVTQFGYFASSESPGHPENVTTTGTSSHLARHTVFRKTVCLAKRLDVPVVVTFSGCPGDSDDAKHPNWVTTPWPPEFLDVLEWQWEKKAIPYWRDAARFAGDHGIKIALEAHPGFLVYNVESALRLRQATAPNLGVNFDPSHFFWQGVDVPQ